MKTLISNYTPAYSSEIVMFNTDGEDVRFKITSENRNSYFHFHIEIQTRNRDFEKVASNSDIPNLIHIRYHDTDEVRIKYAKDNIKLAKDYIKKAFGK